MCHRTHGQTTNCKGCRYWSEMLAKAGYMGIEAMCLNPDSAHMSHYTQATESCNQWAPGHLGAIDEPGEDPNRYDNGDA